MKKLEKQIDKCIPDIFDGLAKCEHCPIGMNTQKGLNLAGQQAIHKVLTELISILFPGCHGHDPVSEDELEECLKARLKTAVLTLKEQIKRTFEYQCKLEECKDCDKCDEAAENTASLFVESLSGIQKILQTDIMAAYKGDPAAKSTMEVVMSYPGVFAVIVHRIAHLLFTLKVPLIPRIMSEHAHSQTGIDIHPGAKIGSGFFIDHGTGVVIGETCVIGKNVKLYQGVTLGAMSFEEDDDGYPIKGKRRHPGIEDNVVIYAGATILGIVTIGAGSEIGGNVWLTHSIPAKSKVYNRQPTPMVKPHTD